MQWLWSRRRRIVSPPQQAVGLDRRPLLRRHPILDSWSSARARAVAPLVMRTFLLDTIAAAAAFGTVLCSVSEAVGAPRWAPQAADCTRIAKEARPAIATLLALDAKGEGLSQGTGFFISDKDLVTCYHVIEGATSVQAKLSNGAALEVLGITAESPELDLAILCVQGAPLHSLPIPSRAKTVQPGQGVIVLGAPLGLEFSVTTGIVSALRDLGQLGHVIQFTAPISPGSSGSPVLDTGGRVIGIVTSQITSGQNLNFAAPSSLLRTLRRHPPTTLREQAVEHSQLNAIGSLPVLLRIQMLIEEQKIEEAVQQLEAIDFEASMALPGSVGREVQFLEWHAALQLLLHVPIGSPVRTRTSGLTESLTAEYEKLIAEDKASPTDVARYCELFLWFGRSEEEQNQQRSKQIMLLRRALESEPNCAEACIQLADLLTPIQFGRYKCLNKSTMAESRKLLVRATEQHDAPLTAWLRLAQMVADADNIPLDIDSVDPDDPESIHALEERLLDQDKADKANARKANRIYEEARTKFPWSVDAAIGWARTHSRRAARDKAFQEVARQFPHAWRILDAWAADLDEALPTSFEPGAVQFESEIKALHYTVYDRLLLACPEEDEAGLLIRLAYACYRYQDRAGIARAYGHLVERDVALASKARRYLEDDAYLSGRAAAEYIFPFFE